MPFKLNLHIGNLVKVKFLCILIQIPLLATENQTETIFFSLSAFNKISGIDTFRTLCWYQNNYNVRAEWSFGCFEIEERRLSCPGMWQYVVWYLFIKVRDVTSQRL
jgi:hypothetical protein